MKSANESIPNNDIKMVIAYLFRNNSMWRYTQRVVGKHSLHDWQ
jgi:hypothetical protein